MAEQVPDVVNAIQDHGGPAGSQQHQIQLILVSNVTHTQAPEAN
jgi:hypothetical protein